MRYLFYGAGYPAHGDHEAEAVASRLLTEDVYTSSGIVVTAAQALVKEGVLNYEHVSAVLRVKGAPDRVDTSTKWADDGDQIMLFNNEGRLSVWPRGFCDTLDKLYERILGF